MKLPKITDLVGKDKKVFFSFYRDGELWYRAYYGEDANLKEFEYPIPKDDMKGATWLAEDKSTFHMRFMRKYLDSLREAMIEQGITVE